MTVIDTSDQDWWKGKCLGKIGFFPSKYVTKLQVGERPLQVTHNLQVSDGDNGLTLLRDQVLMQLKHSINSNIDLEETHTVIVNIYRYTDNCKNQITNTKKEPFPKSLNLTPCLDILKRSKPI